MNERTEQVTAYGELLQDAICDGLEAFEPTVRFREDRWERPGGGGGRSRVLADGETFEKAGVGFSAVHGELPEAAARSLGAGDGGTFFATGVSLVLHPLNPFVPIVHLNVRYFELNGGADRWFGGGIDLTPIYVNPADAAHFHGSLKSLLDPFGADRYPAYKRTCDEYFYIPHRAEMRGIGGIFYDHLHAVDPADWQAHFALMRAVGDGFLSAYAPLVAAHRADPYGERERDWQLVRRGRYAEFNLVYDRGTTFGLRTGGRTESILMSLPPLARWVYDVHPEPGSPEADTLRLLQPGHDWIPA